jgi:hypothetical protein
MGTKLPFDDACEVTNRMRQFRSTTLRQAQTAKAVNSNPSREPMLRIERSANGEVVFKLSGRMEMDNVSELKTLVKTETNGRRITLDLKDLTLVDRDGVIFLGQCQANDIELKNCPAYIGEWIKRERD